MRRLAFGALALAAAIVAAPPSGPNVEAHLIWSTDCPVAQRWADRVARWTQTQTHAKVILWFPNDDEPNARAYARRVGLRGELRPSKGGEIAFRHGLDRLPSVVVERDGKTVFAGGLGDHRDPTQASRFFLSEAVDAARRGRPMAPSRSTPMGCTLPSPLEEKPNPPVTFRRHIQPFLARHCLSCHSPGGAAPFRLDRFQDARRWSHMIEDVLRQGKMPPTQVFDQTLPRTQRVGVTTQDLETVALWREFGAPEGGRAEAFSPPSAIGGKAAHLPPVPVPPLGRYQWVDVPLPVSVKSVRAVEITGARQGEALWAGVYAGKTTPERVTPGGLRWRRTPEDWRLLEAVWAGPRRAIPGDAVELQPGERLAVRLLVYGNETREPLRLRARVWPGRPSDPLARVDRLRPTDGRYAALDGTVEIFAQGAFRQAAQLRAITAVAWPEPTEWSLLRPSGAIVFVRPGMRLPAATVRLNQPVSFTPGELLTFATRFGGPSMMGEAGPQAVVLGEVWNGTAVEAWARWTP